MPKPSQSPVLECPSQFSPWLVHKIEDTTPMRKNSGSRATIFMRLGLAGDA
jgi:hypothetical protein